MAEAAKQDPKTDGKTAKKDEANGLDVAAVQAQVNALQDQLAQALGRIEQLGGKGAVQAKEVKFTGELTHVATARGHIPGIGIVEPGTVIPEGIPVSDNWMKKYKKPKAEDDEAE